MHTDLRRRAAFGATALAIGALAGCRLIPPAPRIPMDTLRPDAGPCPGRAPDLLVMLPGAYSRPREFIDNDFIGAVRRRGLAADILIADAHLGYLEDRSVLDRLRIDVLQPARAQGYRRIWLVGISLGGFVALGMGARHGDEIDGIVAIAPYLGRPSLLQEITQAGGPTAWRDAPPGPVAAADDVERDIWRWLTTPPTERLPVYLGYGREDRFAPAHRMLASLLPADRSVEVPGDHDWPPWLVLWSRWLERGLLPADCNAT